MDKIPKSNTLKKGIFTNPKLSIDYISHFATSYQKFTQIQLLQIRETYVSYISEKILKLRELKIYFFISELLTVIEHLMSNCNPKFIFNLSNDELIEICKLN